MDPDKRAQLIRIATSPDLKNLPAARQADVLNAYLKAPADAAATGTLLEIAHGLTRSGVDDATQAKVLSMATNEAEHPKFTNDLAVLVNDTRFTVMSPDDKSKILNIFGSATPDARKALVSLVQQQGMPPYSHMHDIVTQLDRLQTSNVLPGVTDKSGKTVSKQEVMEDLLTELANPDQNINQSGKGTCTCTSMSFGLAKNKPAEYARLMTDLLTTGKAKLANGDTINPPGDGFTFDGTTRSAGERLLQSALMNYATDGTYMNGPDLSIKNNFQGGLYADQELKVLKGINGKSYDKISGNSFQIVAATVEELKNGKVPILANLSWGKIERAS